MKIPPDTVLYNRLDISYEAQPDDIKRAYKTKAKTLHPDSPGGSYDGFAELLEAYTILKDPDLKANYDATGIWSTMPSKEDAPPEVDFIAGMCEDYFAAKDAGCPYTMLFFMEEHIKTTLIHVDQQKSD